MLLGSTDYDNSEDDDLDVVTSPCPHTLNGSERVKHEARQLNKLDGIERRKRKATKYDNKEKMKKKRTELLEDMNKIVPSRVEMKTLTSKNSSCTQSHSSKSPSATLVAKVP